jgi:metal transporter CNNM
VLPHCSAVLSPIAYPISLVLDCVLGRDIGTVYSQEELKRLMCALQP